MFGKSSFNSEILAKKSYSFIVKKSEEIGKTKKQKKKNSDGDREEKDFFFAKMLAKKIYALILVKSEKIEKEELRWEERRNRHSLLSCKVKIDFLLYVWQIM